MSYLYANDRVFVGAISLGEGSDSRALVQCVAMRCDATRRGAVEVNFGKIEVDG